MARRTRLHGRKVIVLSEVPLNEMKRRPRMFIGPLPIYLWVDARTHLPVRLAGGLGPSPVFQEDWSYLPATPANLALLPVPIPAGYPRHRGKR